MEAWRERVRTRRYKLWLATWTAHRALKRSFAGLRAAAASQRLTRAVHRAFTALHQHLEDRRHQRRIVLQWMRRCWHLSVRMGFDWWKQVACADRSLETANAHFNKVCVRVFVWGGDRA